VKGDRKMKRMIRKISAMTVAAMLTFGMGAPAFADSTINNSYVGAGGSSITFTDTFRISEGDNAQNLPAATFHYSIAPGTGMAATEKSPLIKSGIGSPKISDAEHEATEAGVLEHSVDVTADFSGVGFTEAGIYRYKVTETLADSSAKEDIVIDADKASDNNGEFCLDVYVEKKDGAFRPFAYIMATSAETPNLSSSEAGREAAYTTKIGSVANEYTTYDLTVSKSIVGAMAANDFAFNVNISNVPKDVYIAQDDDAAVLGSHGFTARLGDEDSTVIYGLPSKAAYEIKEEVNKIEGYSVEVVDSNEAEYDWIGTGSFGSKAVTEMGQKDADVAFTNTLMTISPTGVVMRFAPYMMILGAGIALVMVSRRRKAEQE